MVTVLRSRGVAVAAGVVVSLAGTAVQAASDVDVGGFHDRVLQTTQQDLLGASPTPTMPDLGAQLQVRTKPAPSSALTGFTPRLGGLGFAVSGRRHSEASLLAEPDAQPDRLQIGVNDTAQIAGWEIGLAATADMGHAAATGAAGTSALVVGGELAVSGLRLDAAIGREPTFLGEDGRRVTAGIGYDFGVLDTRMSYSLVESEERAAETGLLALDSQLALGGGMVLKGDLAIADEEGGTATTAGRVSLRLNF
jgi:Gram-negative porin